MRVLPVLMLLSTGLVACGQHDSQATATASRSTSASGLAIDTDGFKANVDIPGLSIGGGSLDIDGMKLYPGSKVHGVRVKATDRDGDQNGAVTIDFTSPATPALVSAHLAQEAEKAGFTVSGVSVAGLRGTKHEDGKDDRFAFALTAAGGQTTGQLTMTDGPAKTGG